MKKLLLILLLFPLFGFSQNWAGDYYTNWSVLGWSKDGHVALFEHSVGDMVDGCYYSVVIVNMKTDQIVDELVLQSIFEPEDMSSEEFLIACDSLTLTKKYYKKIHRLYSQYQIIEYSDNKFYSTNIVNNNYEIIFESKDTPVPDSLGELDDYNGCELYWCGNRPVDYSLTIKDSRNKSKILTNGTDWCASHIDYVGYFKSPFESRLLLVIYSKESDFDFQYYSTYRFIGCSLHPSTFK
jgi:hypothetical protein